MDKNDEVLQNLIKRVYHLEQEVIRLGGQPYKTENAAPVNNLQEENVTQVMQAAQEIPPKPEEPEAQAAEAAPAVSTGPAVSTEPATLKPVAAQVSQRAQTVKKASAVKSREDGTFENRIGKNGMAILASVLIFFSLILFAGIVFSYLSDVAKVGIMYAISIAIAIFGVVKMTKIKAGNDTKFKNFYTTVAACGVGAIYITNLVAYFGFECMPLAVFIISIIVWIAVTMFLAYRYSTIFAYICNIGLVIATILTAVRFESSIIAFILYTICLAALYLIIKSKDFNRDSFFFIQYPIVYVIVSGAVKTGIINHAILVVLLLAVFVFANIVYKIELKHTATNVAMMILNVFALIWMCIQIDGATDLYISIILLIGFMTLYYARYYRNNRTLFYITFILAYIVSAILFVMTDMYILVAFIPYIAFLALGFVKKDAIIRAGGYFAVVLSYLIQMDFYESWVIFALYFAILIAAICAVKFIHYSMADKYVITALMCYILLDITKVFDLNIFIPFIIFGVVAFITNNKMYRINLNTGKEELSSRIIGYIIAAGTICSGLICAADEFRAPEMYQVIIILLVVLAISGINTIGLYGKGIPDLVVGFYICIKFSLWISTVLHRLDAASYVVSIVGILVAIICIIIGFKFTQKAFRLYGLIISMVSVIKLILFDISYDSNILRPLGFFIAGVLCFAISFIYSKLEKSIVREAGKEEKSL